MKDLYFEYKKEFGIYPTRDDSYCTWLENKITELQIENQTIKHLHNYKEDYDDAVHEIGQLQDQLENAEDEIRNLNQRQ